MQIIPTTARPQKNGLLLLALAALIFTLAPQKAAAQATANPPTKVTYQGFLTDINGVPIGNTSPLNKVVIFRIYDSLTGGSNMWTAQQTVTFDKGHFSVLLGEGSQVGNQTFSADMSTVFSGATASDRFLELTVDGSTITPRQQFLSSPYSLLARKANELVGGSTISGALNVSGGQTISGGNVLEFGYGVTGKEINAGKIGYGTFSYGNALDIVGAGTNASTRRINLWSEGGLSVAGSIYATSFIGYGTIPVGGIIMWSGSTVPTGWALCDGNNNTPDLRGRFVLGSGAGTGLTSRSIGNSGGAENHTLTTSEMPSHNHTTSASATYNGEHTHGYYSGYNDRCGIEGGSFYDGEIGFHATYNTSTSSGYHNHTISVTVNNNGSGSAHNNMPPYYVLAFIMRTQ